MNMKNLTISESYSEVVLSTAHISKHDNEILIELTSGGNYEGIISTEYGYSIYDNPEFRTHVLNKLSPEAQLNLMALFDAGFDHVVLDCDGDVVPELTQWDW